MAGWINICIEQICGTCFGGCAEAMGQWLPHLCDTIAGPLGEGFQDLCATMMGK